MKNRNQHANLRRRRLREGGNFLTQRWGRGWMWVRVHHCDEDKQLIFRILDNEPVNDCGGTLKLGSALKSVSTESDANG
jgi:hypothetical protein